MRQVKVINAVREALIASKTLKRGLTLFIRCFGEVLEVVEMIDKNVNKLIQLQNDTINLLH